MNEKLKNVQWGEYRIGDLFKKIPTNDVSKNKYGSLPATTAVLTNNQIGKYISKENATILKNVFTATANGYGKAFYQPNEFTVAQDSYAFQFKDESIKIEKIHPIIVTALNKIYSQYDWGNKSGWNKIKELKIKLPTKNGQIDFEFMERFVAELEAQRVAELEAYLQATGLVNYALNKEEEKALKDLEKVEWKEYKIGELFNINSYKKRFDANKVIIGEKGYPYVVRTALNNGVKGYINESEEYLNPAKTISFGQDTATIFYQKIPYFTGDKIKILELKESELKEKKAMYYITAMNKSFKEFSWGRSSFSVDIISNQNIKIPIKNDKPDYEYMESLISAVQKLVIKDVVIYADKKIEATKKVIGN